MLNYAHLMIPSCHASSFIHSRENNNKIKKFFKKIKNLSFDDSLCAISAAILAQQSSSIIAITGARVHPMPVKNPSILHEKKMPRANTFSFYGIESINCVNGEKGYDEQMADP